MYLLLASSTASTNFFRKSDKPAFFNSSTVGAASATVYIVNNKTEENGKISEKEEWKMNELDYLFEIWCSLEYTKCHIRMWRQQLWLVGNIWHMSSRWIWNTYFQNRNTIIMYDLMSEHINEQTTISLNRWLNEIMIESIYLFIHLFIYLFIYIFIFIFIHFFVRSFLQSAD